MTFDLRGKQVTQTGSVYTVALRKVDADWRLTAWAWAKGTWLAGSVLNNTLEDSLMGGLRPCPRAAP